METSKNKISISDDINLANEPVMPYTYTNRGVSTNQNPFQDCIEELEYDFELTSEQHQLINERVAEIENGTAKFITWKEMKLKYNL